MGNNELNVQVNQDIRRWAQIVGGIVSLYRWEDDITIEFQRDLAFVLVFRLTMSQEQFQSLISSLQEGIGPFIDKSTTRLTIQLPRGTL